MRHKYGFGGKCVVVRSFFVVFADGSTMFVLPAPTHIYQNVLDSVLILQTFIPPSLKVTSFRESISGTQLPEDMKDGRQNELIVNGDGHVARLVERRRHRPHGVTQVHRPQQEEELSCRGKKKDCEN